MYRVDQKWPDICRGVFLGQRCPCTGCVTISLLSTNAISNTKIFTVHVCILTYVSVGICIRLIPAIPFLRTLKSLLRYFATDSWNHCPRGLRRTETGFVTMRCKWSTNQRRALKFYLDPSILFQELFLSLARCQSHLLTIFFVSSSSFSAAKYKNARSVCNSSGENTSSLTFSLVCTSKKALTSLEAVPSSATANLPNRAASTASFASTSVVARPPKNRPLPRDDVGGGCDFIVRSKQVDGERGQSSWLHCDVLSTPITPFSQLIRHAHSQFW